MQEVWLVHKRCTQISCVSCAAQKHAAFDLCRYVSTCNVAFDWTDKIGLDEESAEYVSHHTLLDTYSVRSAACAQSDA